MFLFCYQFVTLVILVKLSNCQQDGSCTFGSTLFRYSSCVCVCVFDRHFHTLVCDILYVTKNDSAPHTHRNVNFVAKGLHFVTSRWIKSENLHNKNLNRRFLCILSHATLPKKPKTSDRPNRTRPKKNIFYYNWLDVYCNFTVLPKCLCQTIEMRSRTILNFLSSN